MHHEANRDLLKDLAEKLNLPYSSKITNKRLEDGLEGEDRAQLSKKLNVFQMWANDQRPNAIDIYHVDRTLSRALQDPAENKDYKYAHSKVHITNSNYSRCLGLFTDCLLWCR
jgi:hypothetical protein